MIPVSSKFTTARYVNIYTVFRGENNILSKDTSIFYIFRKMLFTSDRECNTEPDNYARAEVASPASDDVISKYIYTK